MKLTTLAAVAGLAVSALVQAQMVTPPPESAPAPDAHIPKAAPVSARPTRLTPEQMKAAQPVIPAKPVSVKGGWTKPADLPKKDYAPLAERDDTGAIKPLSEPVEAAALRRNPLLGADYLTQPKVQAYLTERRSTIERLVIDMLDVCEKIDGGIVEHADFSTKDNKTALASLSQTLRPLSVGGADASKGGVKSMLVELYEHELLDKDQAGFSDMIVNQYSKELFRGSSTADLMKVVLKAPTAEPMYAYHALIAEAAGKLVPASEGADLDAAGLAALKTSAANFSPSLSPDQKAKIFKDATAGLTLVQRQTLLKRVLELRGQ